MGLFRTEQPNPPLNSEFAKAMPTNGFGEVEATVIASLGYPSAARPLIITTTKPARKVCRIYSPVSTSREVDVCVGAIGGLHVNRQHCDQRDGILRPHTADAAVMREPPNMVVSAAIQGVVSTSTAVTDAEAFESARLVKVQHGNRPTTSDASTQRRQQQKHGRASVRCTTSKIIGGSASRSALSGAWSSRPCTSVGGSRGGSVVSHDGSDGTRRMPNASRVGPPTKDRNGGSSRRQWPLHQQEQPHQQHQEQEHQQQQQQQQKQTRLLQGEGSRKMQNSPGPDVSNVQSSTTSTFDRSLQPRALDSRKGGFENPPNRYWPTPGGVKDFLRPFIERNQKHLWAYDPAFVGMTHVDAYRHIANKGDFEAVKRTLLEKEDALTKGTGSLLMADTIERFRSGSAGKSATSEVSVERGPHKRRDAAIRAMTPTELDPFTFGRCNADMLWRERSRKQDLLMHANTRSTIFCRRKGYEPGDFLKDRSAPPVARSHSRNGRSSGIAGGGGRKNSARLAAAAAIAAEKRRKAQHG